MRRSRPRQSTAIVAAMLAIIMAAFSAGFSGATAYGAAGIVNDEPLAEPTLEISAEALAKDFSVTLQEARRRMALSGRYEELAREAAVQAGPASAGAYIDQTHDGALVLLFTTADAEKAWNESHPDSSPISRTAQVERSTATLNVQSASIRRDLVSAGIPVLLAEVQPEFNRVSVSLGGFGKSEKQTDSSFAVSQTSSAAEIVSKYPGAVLEPGPPVTVTLDQGCTSGYDPTFCNAPLRGGVYMTTTCSTGFRVQSNDDAKQYVLTAGHCGIQCPGHCPNDSSNPVIGTYFYSPQGYHPIGKKFSQLTNGGDASIVRIDNPTGWGDPTTIVFVLDSSLVDNYAHRNETYPINASRVGNQSDLPANDYLCHTGTAIGTSCGKFSGADTNSQFRRVDYCARGGDSGGPVFVRGFGFGLHAGRYPGNLPCPADAGGWSYYQILNTALSGLNVHLIP